MLEAGSSAGSAWRSQASSGYLLCLTLVAVAALNTLSCAGRAHAATVDGDYDENLQGASDGSAQHPYTTVYQGLGGTPVGAQLTLQSGNYPERCRLPISVGQPVTIKSVGGPSTIGNPRGNQRICTTRVVQLTGGYDPEEKAVLNQTAQWGVAGVDLGTSAEHGNRLYFFFGDVVPPAGDGYPARDSDLVAYTEESEPGPNGFRLTTVPDGKIFFPFTVRNLPGAAAETVPLLRDQTPTGAFSYAGKAYVFFTWQNPTKVPPNDGEWHVASSRDPSSPIPYEWQAQMPQKLAQVAPWVVTNSERAGYPVTSGEGLVLFGQSGIADYRGAVYLAWVPLQPVSGPDFTKLQFYTSAPDPADRWSPSEANAVPLFKTKWFWTSLSVGRIRETGLWILLYQRSIRARVGHPEDPDDPEESIVARFSATPWGFLNPDESGEIELFNPVKDGAYQVAKDGVVVKKGFMHRERSPVPDGLERMPPGIGGNGFAYGAYLINRFTKWDAQTHILTIYYLLSTGSPYQVQLMKSEIRLGG